MKDIPFNDRSILDNRCYIHYCSNCIFHDYKGVSCLQRSLSILILAKLNIINTNDYNYMGF